MNIRKIVQAARPVIAMTAAIGLAACDGLDIDMDGGFEGVPLAELDMSGDPPEGVALAGPDNIVITSGDVFEIEVDGTNQARDRLRFRRDEGALMVGREEGRWNEDDTATVLITMPTPSSLVVGGSGQLSSDGLAGDDATIVIGGSGGAVVSNVDAEALSVVIGGSGSASASGNAESLELVVGGSGSADLDELQVDSASVNIAGSGSARFASDGTVDANIAGSGTVRVRGSADCTANTLGSGSLICEDGLNDGGEADEAA